MNNLSESEGLKNESEKKKKGGNEKLEHVRHNLGKKRTLKV